MARIRVKKIDYLKSLILMYISSYSDCADVFLMMGIALCPLALLILLIWFLREFFIALRYWIVRKQHIDLIPCYRCIYYTGYEELKCTVNPCIALTKDASSCLDFESNKLPQNSKISIYK